MWRRASLAVKHSSNLPTRYDDSFQLTQMEEWKLRIRNARLLSRMRLNGEKR